nr:hypothetical protein [Candidatus Sigynarchaeota archaeon]
DMPGAYNIAGDPVSTTELFASRGKSVVYLPFGLVDLAARAAARLLKRRRFDREWLQAVKYQVIVNCDKILGTGAIKNLAPTRAIIDQLLPLIS